MKKRICSKKIKELQPCFRVILKKMPVLILAALMILAALLSGCESESAGQGSEEAESVNESASPEAAESEAGTGEESRDAEEADEEAGSGRAVVTVKSDAGGKALSAKIRRSGDDMEENFDAAGLPFGVTIRYELDGEEILPDALAGKSGELKIRMEYENLSRTDEGDQMVPYAFVSLLILPEEHFSDISVENGGVMELSGNRMVYGFSMTGVEDYLGIEEAKEELNALKTAAEELNDDEEKPEDKSDEDEEPLLPEAVKISCHTENCSIEFSETIVISGLLSDLKEEKLEELTEELRKFADFEDAGNEMTDGAAALLDGVREFQEGLQEYTDGVQKLADGAGKLSGGAAEVSSGAAALASGASELVKGLEGLSAQNESMIAGAEALQKGVDELKEKSAALQELLALLPEEAAGEFAALPAALEALSSGASGLKEGITAYTEGVTACFGGASALSSGASTLSAGTASLSLGANELSSGASELSSHSQELKYGCTKLGEGIDELSTALGDLNEKLFQKLASLPDGAVSDSLNALRVLKECDSGAEDVLYILEAEEF